MSSSKEGIRCSIEKREQKWRRDIESRIADNARTMSQLNERTIWMMRLVLGLLTSIIAAIIIGGLM